MRARDLGFLLAAHRTDNSRTEMLGPLAHNQADAAGGGMDQNGVPSLHAIGIVQQIARGHAADHHRRRRALIDTVGQRDYARGGNQPKLRIGAVRSGDTTHPIADGKAAHLRTDGVDHAGAFQADAGRK